MATYTKKTGDAGEQAACDYLSGLGFTILARNYRSRCGEIDIIARDGRCIVFVEVKTCRSASYGVPAAWVDARKQKKIALTAARWLASIQRPDHECRFDVVVVQWQQNQPQCRHIKEAFILSSPY